MMIARLIACVLMAGTLLAQVLLDTTDRIQNDFFAAVSGDPAALKRVVDACENLLRENPDHAQALVWHGAILLTGAAQNPNTTTQAAARERFQQGVAEVDRAVELDADDVEVRVIRGVIQTKLKDTEYARRAAEWMKTKQPLPESQTGCVGCHAKGH